MALSFVKVVGKDGNNLRVQASDGRVYTVKGDRNLRNNNPGNIEAGSYADSLGAIGSDGRFAVFPDYATGQAAQADLQFNNPRYSSLTIQQAINKYAPPSENDSVGYANGIARALGVPVTTKLADLSPQQRQVYLSAQQSIEGSRPQQLIDSQGNTVQIPPANIPTAVASASQQPIDTSAIAYASPVGMTPATAAIQQATADQGNQSFGANALYGDFAALGAQNGPDAGTSLALDPVTGSFPGQVSLPQPSAAPIPLPDPRQPATASAATPAAPNTVDVNGHTYVVGQSYQLPNGASFKVGADGTFQKTANPVGNPTPLQLAIKAQAPGAMQNLTNMGNQAKGLLGMAAGAVPKLGSMFGGLFGSSPSAGAVSAPAAQPTGLAALNFTPGMSASDASSFYDSLGIPAQSQPKGLVAVGNGPVYTGQGIAGTAQLPANVRPNVTIPAWQDYSSPSGGTSSSSGSSSMAMNDLGPNVMPAADLGSLSLPSSVDVPKYISRQVQVPISQPIEQGSGVHWDATLGNYVMDAPAPAAPTFKTIQVKVPNPAYKAPGLAAVSAAPVIPAPRLSSAQRYALLTGQPVQTINNGAMGSGFASSGNNNASSRAQQTSGGSLSTPTR